MKRHIKVFSKKAGKYIDVDIHPDMPEAERIKRTIGLSNSVASG